jgi:hypothetical protein
MSKSHEDYRKELWIGVCVSVNGTFNCTDHATAAKYANSALAEFDKVFKPQPFKRRIK